MSDTTIIYYTSNRENPSFEARIQQTIIEEMGNLDLPIISVSQKPTYFGKNICVGEVGFSGHNAWRQFQIGALAAKTRFVCTAEADCLHAREYYEFEPKSDNTFYIGNPLWVLFAQRGKVKSFYRKSGSESSMIIGREFIIDIIDKMLDGLGKWHDPTQPDLSSIMYKLGKREDFEMSIPIITFKTDNNMHRKTPYSRSSGTKELPYWGMAGDLVRRYCG
ncbi:hypothetical protein [Methanomethylovorans sp.]|uniref:hypothetical protein n=1 Tax=Methanomethylovorans sp. TaxID=2758717 RepID=UPI00351C423C